jgi:hypothetical protein
MSNRYFGLALATLLALSCNALADNFQFDDPGNVTWNGVYVNPYVATDKTTPPNSLLPPNPLLIYCDDWNTDFSGYPAWSADVLALNLQNLPFFKYGNPATYTTDYTLTLHQPGGSNSDYLGATSQATSGTDLYNRYLEAAWLDNQWQTLGGSSQTQIEIAAAQWTLFVDGSHVGGLIGAINGGGTVFVDAVYSDLISAATAAANGYTAANWDVLVQQGLNSSGGLMQEFLVDSPVDASVPEPSAFILLSTVVGLLAFTTFQRRGPLGDRS